MSGGGGGVIIIKRSVRSAAAMNAVLEELGPRKRAKAEAILAKSEAETTDRDVKFLIGCIADAWESCQD